MYKNDRDSRESEIAEIRNRKAGRGHKGQEAANSDGGGGSTKGQHQRSGIQKQKEIMRRNRFYFSPMVTAEQVVAPLCCSRPRHSQYRTEFSCSCWSCCLAKRFKVWRNARNQAPLSDIVVVHPQEIYITMESQDYRRCSVRARSTRGGEQA